MKKLLLLLMFSIVFLISLVSAEVPTYKQGDIIQITTTCDNCTSVNLTKVTFPNGSIALLGQYPMTKNGTNYNYSFSDTNTFGTHIFVTCGDLDGELTCRDTEERKFQITPSGSLITDSLSIPLFLPMFLMLLITMFWLFLASRVNKEPLKYAFIIFSAIFLILAIAFGIIASKEVLFGFPLLSGFVNSLYYILH